MKAKDLVIVTTSTSDVAAGKVLMVKDVLGSDSFASWYVLTDGGRDYIVYGTNITLSVEYNVPSEA